MTAIGCHLYKDLANSVLRWLTPNERCIYQVERPSDSFDMGKLLEETPEMMVYCLESNRNFRYNILALFPINAMYGNFSNMKWLYRHHFPSTYDTFNNAVKFGNLEVMKWMHNRNFYHDFMAFTHAVEQGNLDNMKWMFSVGMRGDLQTIPAALRNGNIDNIKWLISNGFDYDYDSWPQLIELGVLQLVEDDDAPELI